MNFSCYTYNASVSAYFIISFQMIAISNKNNPKLSFNISFISMKQIKYLAKLLSHIGWLTVVYENCSWLFFSYAMCKTLHSK